MARVSFTLRRNVIDRGSYTRYDSDVYNAAASAGNAASAGTWIVDDPLGTRDNDTSLRSDGYSLPPTEFAESFFEASAVAYGIVQLNWGVTLSTPDVSPAPSQTILVYSTVGPAATISSGIILSESNSEFEYLHAGVPQGSWAYYTLFVRYQSTGGDDYYEPAASLEVLVPANYGSTALLWNRIPQYYRDQDTRIGIYVDPDSDYAQTELGVLPPGNVVGPLYRFLAVFGFEMDRTRTLIDYIMVSKDPLEASTEALTALSTSLGLGITPANINSSRIRAVLDDIGYLRRTKGTPLGIAAYGRALSGCDIDIDQANRQITFFSQRVNYITDPQDATGMITHRPAHAAEAPFHAFDQGSYDPTSYNPADENTYPVSITPYAPGMYWTAASAGTFNGIPVNVGDYIAVYGDGQLGVAANSFDATNYSAFTTYSQTGATYTPNGSGASVDVTHVMFHIDCPIPVRADDSVVFSVHSGIGSDALVWARLVTADGDVIGRSTSLTRAGDYPAAEVIATDNLSTTSEWTIGFIEFLIDLESVTSYVLTLLLAERNHLGGYFDGNSRRGGWLVDPTGNTVSDYRWSSEGENNGNAYESISVYTEDYQRTRALLLSFFANALPITQYPYYTITATDAIPGQSAIDTYLTTP